LRKSFAMPAQLDALRERLEARGSIPPWKQRRELRKRAGLTLQEIADACGVSRECVRLWELGANEPRRENGAAYLRVLELLQPATGSIPPRRDHAAGAHKDVL
jgi:DNA-binding transcriptional regulator YiaG